MSEFRGNKNNFFYDTSIQNVAELATRFKLSLIQSIINQKQVSDHMYGNKSAILSKFPKGTCKAAVDIKHNINGLTGAEVIFIGESIQSTKRLSAASCGITTACVRLMHASDMHHKTFSSLESRQSVTFPETSVEEHHVGDRIKTVSSIVIKNSFYPNVRYLFLSDKEIRADPAGGYGAKQV